MVGRSKVEAGGEIRELSVHDIVFVLSLGEQAGQELLILGVANSHLIVPTVMNGLLQLCFHALFSI